MRINRLWTSMTIYFIATAFIVYSNGDRVRDSIKSEQVPGELIRTEYYYTRNDSTFKRVDRNNERLISRKHE